jgi:hypothetical protein
MDLNGFLVNLIRYANDIDVGRRGLSVYGKEGEAHVTYESGVSSAIEAFKEAQKSADCEVLARSEFTFMTEELNLCTPGDKDKEARDSLSKGVQDFRDAIRCLKAVKDKAVYQGAETTYPT